MKTYTDATVSPGLTYTYVVTALNAHAESENSPMASVTLPPGPVTLLGTTATAYLQDGSDLYVIDPANVDHTPILMWQPVQGALSYTVMRSTNGGAAVAIGTMLPSDDVFTRPR